MKIPSLAVKRKARIEIIPLIDIVFFLLATFVMVSMSMVKNQSIHVQLPRASSAVKEESKTSSVTVSVNESGEIYYNKERVGLDEMKGRLTAVKRQDADSRVILQADERASFGSAIQIMDEIRKLGLTKISIQTKSDKS